MKGKVYIVLALGLLWGGVAWGYGEGPSHSGRWVHGIAYHSGGSVCKRCCRISVATENGFSKSGCSNARGWYKIYVASQYARAVYFRGSRVWRGSSPTKGGARIDIRAR